MRRMTWRAIYICQALVKGCLQLKKRKLGMHWMTWRAISARYRLTQYTTVRNELDDVAGSICQVLPYPAPLACQSALSDALRSKTPPCVGEAPCVRAWGALVPFSARLSLEAREGDAASVYRCTMSELSASDWEGPKGGCGGVYRCTMSK